MKKLINKIKSYFKNLCHYKELDKVQKRKVINQTAVTFLVLLFLFFGIVVFSTDSSDSNTNPTPEDIKETLINDTLLLDWNSEFDKEPSKILGIAKNKIFFTLEDELYENCLYSYNFDTKESKQLAKYFQLENDYNLSENFLLFFAATDEKGEQIELMSCNIESLAVSIAPQLSITENGEEKTVSWKNISENFSLRIVLNDSLYFQFCERIYSYNLKENYFTIVTDITTQPEGIALANRQALQLTFDNIDKTLYYAYDIQHVSENGYDYENDEYVIYQFNPTSSTVKNVATLKTTSYIENMAVVNGNIFLQDSNYDIYQIIDNTEKKVMSASTTEISLENMMREDAFPEITAFFNENNLDVLTINSAGNTSIIEFSKFDAKAVLDCIDGDYITSATYSIGTGGEPVAGIWFFDNFSKDGKSGIVSSYVPCTGKYIGSQNSKNDKGEIVTTIYLYADNTNFKFIDATAEEIPTGIYAIPSTHFINTAEYSE